MTSPDWGRQINPNPDIHTPPPEVKSVTLTPQYVGLIGGILLDLFLAQVALALGGITILGVKPFDFLTAWGEDLQQRASDAYNNALSAQRGANYANSQLALLTGGAFAGEVAGGVSVSAQFNESTPATTLTGFSRVESDGSGGGTFGPNGIGQAVWTKSGGLYRRHVDLYDTTLATDYQAVFAVLFEPPQGPYLGQQAYTYLVARAASDGSEFVFARIGVDSIAIGVKSASTYTLLGSQVDLDVSYGDTFTFIVGTSDDVREFVVRQNGVEVINRTDAASSYGASYRHVGVASLAADRGFLIIPFFEQTVPASLDLWAAADRLASDEGGGS